MSDELLFEDIVIFYNYVFDIGKPGNIIDYSRKLLNTDIGLIFPNYLTDKYELATNLEPLANAYTDSLSLIDMFEIVQERHGLKAYIDIYRRNPKLFRQIVIPMINSTIFRNDYTNNLHEETDNDHTGKDIAEGIIEDLSLRFGDLLGILAVHKHVDKEILSQSYLDTVPYTRLSLSPFGTILDGENIQFDVSLTIHRSGVAILTAFGVFNKPKNVQELLKIYRLDTKISSCYLSKSVYKRFIELQKDTDGFDEFSNIGKKYEADESGYINVELVEESEIGGIFDIYRYFIIDALGEHFSNISKLENSLRSTSWSAYPIIFIRKTNPIYQSSQQFKNNHSENLSHLILTLRTNSPINQSLIDKTIQLDQSIVDKYSLYITEGNVTVIYYEDWSNDPIYKDTLEWFRQYFLTTVVIDMLIIQRGILRTYIDYLERANHELSNLHKLRQEYLRALDEFEVLGLSYYGSVHGIIKTSQELLRINDLRNLFLLKLESIESLIDIAENRAKSNRTKIIKILTSIIAAIFSLTAINSFIDSIAGFPQGGLQTQFQSINDFYNIVISYVSTNKTSIIIITYICFMLFTLLIIWFENVSLIRRKRKVVPIQSKITEQEKLTSPISINLVPMDTDNGDHENGN